MSTINVTNLSGRGGATPNLPDGANITGVATATTFDGNLKSTGTPTLGLGVTINSSGVNVSGVLTATSFVGSGSGLTGVGETIAPWHYNPDINDTSVDVDTGIGITFNKKIEAGSGTATLKIVNAGTAGTTIQSWGVSSCTFNVTEFTLGSLVSDLIINQTYQVDIPSGFLVDSNETSYAGTAYTFTAQPATQLLFTWGGNEYGETGHNNTTEYSSPRQVPGTNWGVFNGDGEQDGVNIFNVKTDGTLWGWGEGGYGQMEGETNLSSPTQIGSDTTWRTVVAGYYSQLATKTDGTLWAWGYNGYGQSGQNNRTQYSSPVQIPGTTWSDNIASGANCYMAIKTDGTAWAWGRSNHGQLAQNNLTQYSSPVQIPGTTWRSISAGKHGPVGATKTDGTLWVWGSDQYGAGGQNSVLPSDNVGRSSPVQIPGTNWTSMVSASSKYMMATKTDGTLWSWGYNGNGNLGHNNTTNYSSPVQVPGTTWPSVKDDLKCGELYTLAIKTDGTLWHWGKNNQGQGGHGNTTQYSSPKQVGSSTDWTSVSTNKASSAGILRDTTP